MKISSENKLLLEGLSEFLNKYEKSITTEDIKEMLPYVRNEEEAFIYLLASIFQLEIDGKDKEFFNTYFPHMVRQLSVDDYLSNPYMKSIKINNKKNKDWELKIDSYKPYEAFVRDDFIIEDGKIIPQIGFFNEEFHFPAVYQNNRLWMSIIPNEINTMKDDIESVYGNVLICGLGLGYFPYMVSIKDNVSSITIVEKDKMVIELFKEEILPQFENKDKITIIEADAFEYLEKLDSNIDTVYIDLWHDVSDGLPMYLKLLYLRDKYIDKKIMFWIEKTIKCYL